MSFFEPPSPPPASPEHDHPKPAWMAPPDHVLPGVVPLELLLARTEETAVAVTGLRAYPTGLQLTLSLRLRRRPSGRDAAWLGQGLYHLEPFGAEGLPDELLRFGVQFADGRKPINLTHPLVGDDQEPAPPVLMPEGGGGGDRRWDQQYWLWPLPPPGPLAFVCEWPARQVPESRVEADTRPVLEAAARAVTLWPDDDSSGPGGGGGGPGTYISR